MNRPRKGSGKRAQQVRGASNALDRVIAEAEAAADKSRAGQVQKSVTAFFEHKNEDKKNAWDTEGKGLAPEGEFLTLEDLIYLKPFPSEDLEATIAFRANDKMLRAFQRLKEASGGTYDISSDLYRDAAVIGLLVLSERHKSILGLEIVISRAENHMRNLQEAKETVLRFKESIRPLDDTMRKTYFQMFMEGLADRPRWNQETHLAEMRGDKLLSGLLAEMDESD